ncbi:MAG: geranylgeranyl reductase family protein [Ferruginibacter sp.]|nr:geranylgeranyl reductase family protein [Ferruginibacter sp.]
MIQPQKIKTSICIIGAGPAGSTASIFLCKAGIQHMIVDAASFPRDKVCGDGLDLNTIRVLNHIDPAIIEKELSVKKDQFTSSQGFRFILPSGRKVDIMRRQNDAIQPMFFVSKRIDFDNLLLSKIDRSIADVRLATRIETISRTGKTWKLEGEGPDGKIEIETGFLIGADGDHSIVLRHLGERTIDRNNYAGAVRQYWSGVEGMHTDNLLEVYFPKRLPLSYFWIFPLPGGKANVGYGMASNYVARNNINVRKEFEELIKTDPVLIPRFKNAKPDETVKGWGIPMSGKNRKAYGEGWLLLGDAASMVCPTSGEGIGSGMLSGYVAAKFLQRAVQQNDFSEKMFTNYNREIHKRLKTEEKVYRFVNSIPPKVFSIGINTILSTRLFKYWMSNKAMKKWVDTAYNKEIEVRLT